MIDKIGDKHMAIIKCPECGKEISDSVVCPECGCEVADQPQEERKPIKFTEIDEPDKRFILS